MSKQGKAINVLKRHLKNIEESKDVLNTDINVYSETVRVFLGPESKLPNHISHVISLNDTPMRPDAGIKAKKKRLAIYISAAIDHISEFGVYEKDKKNLLDGESNIKIIGIGAWILGIGFTAGVGFSELKNMLFSQDVNHIENKYEDINKTMHDVDTVDARPNGR